MSDLHKGAQYESFITTENFEAGKACGEAMIEQLGEKGRYVEITGPAGSHAAGERTKGFHSVVDKYPGWEMIAQQSGDYKRDKSMSLMEDILLANPGEIDALYTHYDEMALGALLAIKDAGRGGEIKIFSANAGSKEYLEAIMNGEANVAVPYPFLAKEGIDIAMKVVRGEEVSKKIVVPPDIVTKDSVEDFYDPNSPY
jgi:ribose transport system substrate-binding protein